mmetsp:Transcript_143492/g.458819  ORF Transcript_143492/g.458819 Transcript_143492/m.458819 type:complete len:204 (-) Transcript_143492:1723-2334(-)
MFTEVGPLSLSNSIVKPKPSLTQMTFPVVPFGMEVVSSMASFSVCRQVEHDAGTGVQGHSSAHTTSSPLCTSSGVWSSTASTSSGFFMALASHPCFSVSSANWLSTKPLRSHHGERSPARCRPASQQRPQQQDATSTARETMLCNPASTQEAKKRTPKALHRSLSMLPSAFRALRPFESTLRSSVAYSAQGPQYLQLLESVKK